MIDQITRAVYSALLVDLPVIAEQRYTYNNGVRSLDPEREVLRRPTEKDVDIYSFPQNWGSTALGFGGVGGQAITTAQTTVVISINDGIACVYFGGRLAYKAKASSILFEDIMNQNMAEVSKARKYSE